MKRLASAILCLLLLSPPLTSEINRPEMRGATELYYHEDFYNLNSFEEIAQWIRRHVRYETELFDRWTGPRETLYRGYGDCDDYAILFMNIAYVRWGIRLDFVAVNHINRTEPDLEPIHAEVRWRWHTYSIYTGEAIEIPTYLYYLYPFEEIFKGY